MTKTLLINFGVGEIRCALLNGDSILHINFFREHEPSLLGQQFEANVTKIETQMNGAFVTFGNQQAFLPRRGILNKTGDKNTPLTSLLHEGQSIVVEVTRDAIAGDNKQPIVKMLEGVHANTQTGIVGQILAQPDYNKVEEIIVDDLEELAQLKNSSDFKNIHYHDGDQPLFETYGIEDVLTQITNNKTPLPSGGWVTIEGTSALTAVDVNAGNAGTGKMASDQALKLNIEAANAIAIAIRQQNIGGLIVIDFLDMKGAKAKSTLENSIKTAFANDPLHVELGKISSFGLFEVKRKRGGESIYEKLMVNSGVLRADAMALDLLRQAKHQSRKATIGNITISAPSNVLAWLNDNDGLIKQLQSQTARNVKLKESHNNSTNVEIS